MKPRRRWAPLVMLPLNLGIGAGAVYLARHGWPIPALVIAALVALALVVFGAVWLEDRIGGRR